MCYSQSHAACLALFTLTEHAEQTPLSDRPVRFGLKEDGEQPRNTPNTRKDERGHGTHLLFTLQPCLSALLSCISWLCISRPGHGGVGSASIGLLTCGRLAPTKLAARSCQKTAHSRAPARASAQCAKSITLQFASRRAANSMEISGDDFSGVTLPRCDTSWRPRRGEQPTCGPPLPRKEPKWTPQLNPLSPPMPKRPSKNGSS